MSIKQPSSIETEHVSSDTLYSAFSDTRRRYGLHFLKQRNEPVDVRELTEQVAAWENNKPIEELTSQERKRVYISFYQSHLSTMDEQGLIEYDTDTGMVELSESMRSVDLYLEVVPKESIPWSTYFVGLSVANAFLLLFAWLDVYPFNGIPDIVWGAVVLASFAISALVQYYYTKRQMRIGDEGPPPEFQAKNSR